MKKTIFWLVFLGIVVGSWPGTANALENDVYKITDPWVYTITHKTLISNPAKEDIKNVRVTIPLMNQDQPPYQEMLGEEINPWPVAFINDSKTGTRQGVFEIPIIKAGSEVVLEQRYAVRNFAIKYNVESWQVSSDYSKEKFDPKYLQPENKIESNHPLVIKYAQDTVKDQTNPYLMAQKLFADINLFMTYQDGPNANQGALNAIRTGVGNCEDYTDLLIAAARALGIPARQKTGYLYLPRDYNSSPYMQVDGSLNLSLMRHTWPEIFLPEIGWMVLDPTFTYTIKSGNKQEKGVDWSKFGNISPSSRHIFFGYGSDDNGRIELKYRGSKIDVRFSENLVFGNDVFPFRDAVNHWAKDSIMYLTGITPRIIGGYGNGLFGPDDQVTRAQLSAMLNRALSLDYHVGKPQFSDITPGYWGYADIAAAKGAGIVAGFPDGTFRPERYVTRAELAVIFDRAYNLPYPASGTSFNDLGKSGFAWADASIIRMAGNGIAGGYPGRLFRPEKTVTRAEVAVFLSRIMDGAFRLKVN